MSLGHLFYLSLIFYGSPITQITLTLQLKTLVLNVPLKTQYQTLHQGIHNPQTGTVQRTGSFPLHAHAVFLHSMRRVAICEAQSHPEWSIPWQWIQS